jgi:hypothetical protein
MNFHFDLRGNLRPYELLETGFTAFQEQFASSPNRIVIFQHFALFLNRLKAILQGQTEIWVDGSFITKKLNPRDIDLVVFIDYQDFAKNEVELRQLFTEFDMDNERKVDAYPVILYPETHPNYTASRSDCLYWLDLFGKTRPNRADKRFSKGIIKITT